ncbi:hypothetical protein DH2020_042411 [Rehmannia glutinosa]|uniref:Uncharacterized protein n=1 Tax=Rehmannia glutinosa TaxID=99300 RepID=A0ABR0UMF5_REHGL
MLVAEPKAIAKHREKEKSPSPTSSMLWPDEDNRICCTLWEEYVDVILPYLDQHSLEALVMILQICRGEGTQRDTRSNNSARSISHVSYPVARSIPDDLTSGESPFRLIDQLYANEERDDWQDIPDELAALVDKKVLFKVQVKADQGHCFGVFSVMRLTIDHALLKQYFTFDIDSQDQRRGAKTPVPPWGSKNGTTESGVYALCSAVGGQCAESAKRIAATQSWQKRRTPYVVEQCARSKVARHATVDPLEGCLTQSLVQGMDYDFGDIDLLDYVLSLDATQVDTSKGLKESLGDTVIEKIPKVTSESGTKLDESRMLGKDEPTPIQQKDERYRGNKENGMRIPTTYSTSFD